MSRSPSTDGAPCSHLLPAWPWSAAGTSRGHGRDTAALCRLRKDKSYNENFTSGRKDGSDRQLAIGLEKGIVEKRHLTPSSNVDLGNYSRSCHWLSKHKVSEYKVIEFKTQRSLSSTPTHPPVPTAHVHSSTLGWRPPTSLCQSITPPLEKKLFFVFNPNLPWCNTRLLPLIRPLPYRKLSTHSSL